MVAREGGWELCGGVEGGRGRKVGMWVVGREVGREEEREVRGGVERGRKGSIWVVGREVGKLEGGRQGGREEGKYMGGRQRGRKGGMWVVVR